jgi:hypothetical protein
VETVKIIFPANSGGRSKPPLAEDNPMNNVGAFHESTHGIVSGLKNL